MGVEDRAEDEDYDLEVLEDNAARLLQACDQVAVAATPAARIELRKRLERASRTCTSR